MRDIILVFISGRIRYGTCIPTNSRFMYLSCQSLRSMNIHRQNSFDGHNFSVQGAGKEIEVLAEKDEYIHKAYDKLEEISADEEKRL